MTVRLSTSQIYNRGLNAMLDVQKAANHTQQQISTNKRVLSPADDPIAAARILQLRQEKANTNQFNNSLSTLDNRLQREETAIAGISDQIQKAQELITQSGNAALNKDQRKFIAVELQSLVDGMAQLMNSRDASGEYLFSGYQGKTQPFEKGADGRYAYQGDEGQRFIQVGPVTSIAANDSGYEVFMNIPGVESGFRASASERNTAVPPARMDGGVIRDREQFERFYPESAVIEFNSENEVSPPGVNFSIRQVSDGRVISENLRYVSGNNIEFNGLSVRIQGKPAPGDTFMVESDNRKGLLGGIEDYIQVLQQTGNSTADRQIRDQALSRTITNLDGAQGKLLDTRAAIGARLNQVESAKSSNDDFDLVIDTALSELEDLDIAKAISQLTQETFVLEAAQASFSKVSKLSLFNYF
ncbi:flagellar hook-associated protein FlgL [Pseudohongiella sp.]|uniref:Flagellin N-terminal domain-containing protein n=1 Tax=marine sediment metagenome TaxID=412755 RepID=A0A0F9W2Y7_9ZZZZ|nr:flagellar hook-associated protein FlgL [Pseudohongiella sp.]HDZ09146.1 flagellar hook-associated protein 3 [Pseudohongiella sp.]HEA63518.1 flagellar hook-associated protein 3 [Pseudohongiella sp.]